MIPYAIWRDFPYGTADCWEDLDEIVGGIEYDFDSYVFETKEDALANRYPKLKDDQEFGLDFGWLIRFRSAPVVLVPIEDLEPGPW